MKNIRNILAANLILMSCITNSGVTAATQATPSVPVASVTTPAVPTSGLRVAVVDIGVFQQQFLEEVNTKLEAQFKDRQADIQKMVNKFRDDQDKLQKDANIMTAKKVDEAKDSLIKQQNQLQIEAKKFDDDLNQKRQQELKIKLDDLTKVVNTISANKYDMVIAKNVTLFTSEQFDITDQVVKAYKDLVAAKTASNAKGSKKTKNA